MHVTLDVTQPLCRERIIDLEKGKEQWVSFKCEHLPNLCYCCGRLSHDDKDCELWFESEGTLSIEDQKYGLQLRAQPLRLSLPQGKMRFQFQVSMKRRMGSLVPKSPLVALISHRMAQVRWSLQIWTTIPKR